LTFFLDLFGIIIIIAVLPKVTTQPELTERRQTGRHRSYDHLKQESSTPHNVPHQSQTQLDKQKQVAASVSAKPKSYEPDSTQQHSTAEQEEAKWYFAVDDDYAGPYTMSQLKAFFVNGDLGRNTLVWQPGMADWQEAGELAELQTS
jgi:hypothetical protein